MSDPTSPNISEHLRTSPNSEDTEDTNKAEHLPHAPSNAIFGGTVQSPVKDVETGAIVWRPPVANGRVVVMYEDGLMVTRHSDGTVQRWRKRESETGSEAEIVLVECAGFPSVEVRKSK